MEVTYTSNKSLSNQVANWRTHVMPLSNQVSTPWADLHTPWADLHNVFISMLRMFSRTAWLNTWKWRHLVLKSFSLIILRAKLAVHTVDLSDFRLPFWHTQIWCTFYWWQQQTQQLSLLSLTSITISILIQDLYEQLVNMKFRKILHLYFVLCGDCTWDRGPFV